jgi:hypothetical protein
VYQALFPPPESEPGFEAKSGALRTETERNGH